MRILVTGGAGFIGSHVADRLLELGHHVVILDNLSTGSHDNIPPQASFIKGDITDMELVKELFQQYRFEIVNHHAAQMNVRHSVDDPVFDARVNILGTINLLQSSIREGVKKFIFSSTGGAIYGEQQDFPADENHPLNPVSPYGISKLACEKYIYYHHVEYGLAYATLRYANVYGPRQNPHGEAGVVAIFSNLLANGKQVTINGDGLQTRDYVYVGDVVEANVLTLTHHDTVTLNIGTGIETDVVTLYEYLAGAAGTSRKPSHGPPKPGEQRRSAISPRSARKTLGWEPKISLADGLPMTYRSFKK
ncbi:MAG: SDR family NAD(P)-dependent oxidoreductase [Fidelibacterota bacterium]|nr:MAG: SDR family NAD(P)-dependent oxidoreductase [Candidatus Neomarinimicrobiota bacterium]